MQLGPPLSWKEARVRLKSLLEEYIDDAPTPVKKREHTLPETRSTLNQICIKRDLDFYVGAGGASIALLIISGLAFASRIPGSPENNVEYSRIDRSQLSGSILVVLGCIFNLWLVRRRRFSTSQGSDSLKRREIHRFLKEFEKQEEECFSNQPENTPPHDSPLNLAAGTSLTDIYRVYRLRYSHKGSVSGGLWSRIPTLLLVQGDHVALQVGDLTPASCKLVDSRPSAETIEAGERITLATFGETTTSATEKLSRGRTTLPIDSEDLLALCNNTQIFELLESPLESFLREPRVESRKPQISRQLEAIRGFLSIAALSIFASTVVILVIRLGLASSDLSYVLPIPFLAAIGVFPFTAPACLIFIEALGTARILASYHPVASLSQENASGSTTNMDMLLLRYFLATVSNRLSLQDFGRKLHRSLRFFSRLIGRDDGTTVGPALVRVPPASLNLLEKLGEATAFTLVDDELVCEPHAIPQQLLIPSGKGLKLLDICPTYEDDSDEGGDSDTEIRRTSRRSFDGDFHDSDSDSEDGFENHHHMPSRRKHRRLLKKAHKESMRNNCPDSDTSETSESVDHEVQFEDPLWWQHLPSLKCIGLACLLVEQKEEDYEKNTSQGTQCPGLRHSPSYDVKGCKTALVQLVCAERRSMQLRSLAQCIGFSLKENSFGGTGDMTPFDEKFRLHVISTARVKERLAIDSHERGSEESRWWGLLRPDSTSVIVQDKRSGAYQLVTVGDPRVVTRMCQEAWQGENSTILPLAAHDRATILETSNSWRLGDLDVEAFSYTPIPHTFETICASDESAKSKFYLLDNDPRGETLLPMQKDKSASGEWPLLYNQIFLGILGSLVIPRQETQGLLSTLQDAGVRFVFMSPRNMRLTKEIASQMGIDVAWNCAISLRPLDQGEEDPHRMVSAYADWDVNAKLPHGIESVKRHLEEVDNVPLLVSLFTDVTKMSCQEMIETFQEYHDTVIAVGLSHLPWNSRIFATADLAVGVDVLTNCLKRPHQGLMSYNSLLPSEMVFVSAISAHACAFRLRGEASIAYMPTILAHGRASLEAATSASIFLVSGCLSFAFYALFCGFSVAKTLPFVPIIGAVICLQVILPLVGLPITMSDPDKQSMHRVPKKNDPAVTFAKKEGKSLCLLAVAKALPPAALPHVLYLIAFGEFMIHFEPELVASKCSPNLEQGDWGLVIRCDGLSGYSGIARNSASAVAFAELLICTVLASAAFVHRTLPVYEEPPWRRNHIWVYSVLGSLLIVAAYLGLTLENGSFSVLPWYFFILASIMPLICLAWDEVLKKTERSLLDRAGKLRRLQFETRLGMWSPK